MGFSAEKVCVAFVFEENDEDFSCWRAVVNDLDLDSEFKTPGEAYDGIVRWATQRGLTVTLPFVEIRRVVETDE